jgi:hypothetical protein
MSGLDIDDMVHVEIGHCYFCGVELSEDNKSMWSPFAKVNGEMVIVDQCKECDAKISASGAKMPDNS